MPLQPGGQTVQTGKKNPFGNVRLVQLVPDLQLQLFGMMIR